MHARRRLLAARGPVVAVVAVAVAGCGGHGHGHDRHKHGTNPDVAVITGWANALREGHVRAAAKYFEIPSVFANGPGDTFVLHSLRQAEIVNRLLPCGAIYVSSERHGNVINALFRLSDRRGPGGGTGGCGTGAGQTARVVFKIDRGKISRWVRAPSQPGDNGPPQTATSPGTNTVPLHMPPTTTTAPTPTETSTTPNPAV